MYSSFKCFPEFRSVYGINYIEIEFEAVDHKATHRMMIMTEGLCCSFPERH